MRRSPGSHRSTRFSLEVALHLAQAAHALEDLFLTLVEPLLDVRREQECATGSANAERDRHGVVTLVGDRHCYAPHAQLLGATRGSAMELDRWRAGRQALDLDLCPAHAT